MSTRCRFYVVWIGVVALSYFIGASSATAMTFSTLQSRGDGSFVEWAHTDSAWIPRITEYVRGLPGFPVFPGVSGIIPGTISGQILAGDVNGDGRTDIICVFGNPGLTTRVLLSKGDGSFAESKQTDTQWGYAGQILAGDVNGDRRADIVCVWGPSMLMNTRVLRSNGDGSFSEWTGTGGLGVGGSALIGDLNADRRADLVFFGTSSILSTSTGFDPARHGFSFPNKDWGRICCKVDGFSLKYDPNGQWCDADWGLCGGMSLLAGERFRQNLQSMQLAKDAAKADIVNAQFRTLTGETVMKWLNWISAPDKEHWHDVRTPIGELMQEDWENAIKPNLDQGKPIVVGLVRSKTATVFETLTVQAIAELFKQHQVLAIGYRQRGNKVRISAYDPNFPQDTLFLQFSLGATGVMEALVSGASLNRTEPRGVMFVRGVP